MKWWGSGGMVLFVMVGMVFAGGAAGVSQGEVERIEGLVRAQMEVAGIPGLAMVVVRGDRTVYLKGFGLADVAKGQGVTAETLFELGECSMAFTALGLLRLEQAGKLTRHDAVEYYLPWLEMKYKGKPVTVRISDLLYHTSGIPPETVGSIPIGRADDALEQTVRALIGVELDHYPGFRFSYAPVNYDVLGLIIQRVSGQSFEAYMQESILEPLGLTDTYLFHGQAPKQHLAAGHKIAFKQPRPYEAPIYRGHTPAAYFTANARDMAGWLKIQLGSAEWPEEHRQWIGLIESSHKTEPGVFAFPYANGWFLHASGRRFSSSGSTPTFSASIVFKPTEKLGAAVLANMNTGTTQGLAEGILKILEGKEVEPALAGFDANRWLDNLSIKVLYATVPLIAIIVLLLMGFGLCFRKKQRRFRARGWKGVIYLLVSTAVIGAAGCGLYMSPRLLAADLPWRVVRVWWPTSFIYAVLSVSLALILVYVYALLKFFFPKRGTIS
jgi:putative ATP-binding cassette transporter